MIDRDPASTSGQLNSLADGNYQITLAASQVTSRISGALMAVDYQFGADQADGFFRRFGDINGDRLVDLQDYGQFAPTFLKTSADPAYNAEFDFDGDGDVDGIDYGQLGLRLNKFLPGR